MASSTDHKMTDMNTETIEAVAFNEAHSGGRDKAAQMLKEAGHFVVVTPEDNKRILRKIDRAILPIILVIYCLQSLDKTALSYASVFGLIKDTNLKGQEFSWLGAIVYVAQLVWQPCVAYFLVKLPLGKFCATMVLCWGITLCGMSAAHDFGGLMAARFVLGSFEASVAPTFIALLGSLLTYGLGHIQSKVLHSYQIIFLFCGCLTVAFSALVFVFLPDSPMQARFLTSDDKLIAIERLPLIYSWSGQNTAGDTKRKVTTGMMFIGASVGNIIGPNLYKPSEAPHYTRGLRSNLALFCVIIVLVGLGVAWIRVLNRKHAAQRISLGKAGKIIDLSMENTKTLAKDGEAVNGSHTADGIGEKAFDDVTDLRNEDFIYVY
ncbi:hypothetical protein LTR32_002867 [Rachicladosporium monterosium]|uniref:Major facilitator superfamily (MFS) profile domain-containing protein n=1 Tax=Rachicladosporium monterosium TaxID=1507873 RepID=A0ABR0L964_9PEZI|nr:hypothetical protein LTR32_002867 [Rachicladosporium monterosium]